MPAERRSLEFAMQVVATSCDRPKSGVIDQQGLIYLSVLMYCAHVQFGGSRGHEGHLRRGGHEAFRLCHGARRGGSERPIRNGLQCLGPNGSGKRLPSASSPRSSARTRVEPRFVGTTSARKPRRCRTTAEPQRTCR